MAAESLNSDEARAGGREIDGDEEDLIFAEASGGGGASGGDGGGSDAGAGTGAGEGEGEGEGEGAAGSGSAGDAGAAGTGAAGASGAGEAAAAADGASGTGGAGGAAAAGGETGAGGASDAGGDPLPLAERVAARRSQLIELLGATEVAPADEEGGVEAMTLAQVAEEYPAILNTVLAVTEQLYGPVRSYVEAEQSRRERDNILAGLEQEIPGARAAAESTAFTPWIEKQPTEIRNLAYRGGIEGGKRVMALFRLDHPDAFGAAAGESAGGKGGGKADAGVLDETTRARRLGAAAASSAAGRSRLNAGMEPGSMRVERLPGGVTAADEDDVEAEFDRLCAGETKS